MRLRVIQDLAIEAAVIAALAAAMLWLLPGEAAAQQQQQRESGAIVHVTRTATPALTNAVELEVGARGLWLEVLNPAETATYGFRIDSSSLCTANQATIVPRFSWGPSALTTVVRECTVGTTVAAEGDAVPVGTLMSWPANLPRRIFVPSGSFVTVLRSSVNTALSVTVGFSEPPPPPTFQP